MAKSHDFWDEPPDEPVEIDQLRVEISAIELRMADVMFRCEFEDLRKALIKKNLKLKRLLQG